MAKDPAFLFYPNDKNVVVNFTIVDININVKIKLNNNSTYGLFIWANELQLNDSIMNKIQHIKSSFDNWRNSLIKDNTILNDMQNFINAKVQHAKVNQSNRTTNYTFPESDKLTVLDVAWEHQLNPKTTISSRAWVSDSDIHSTDVGGGIGVEFNNF